MSDDLLNVGPFAKRAGLSVHALRHYDALGLLKRLIPIEGVVAVWKSPALSSGLAIVDEVSEPTRGSHRGVRVIR